jgi:hypothetical protein
MNLDLTHIILLLLSILLLSVVAVLFSYIRKVIAPIIAASEESAQLFTHLETYEKHLSTVYELPTFYGDETLKSLLEHTRNLVVFFERYEDIYSFAQPDLVEILQKVDDEYNQEETQEEKE